MTTDRAGTKISKNAQDILATCPTEWTPIIRGTGAIGLARVLEHYHLAEIRGGWEEGWEWRRTPK